MVTNKELVILLDVGVKVWVPDGSKQKLRIEVESHDNFFMLSSLFH